MCELSLLALFTIATPILLRAGERPVFWGKPMTKPFPDEIEPAQVSEVTTRQSLLAHAPL